ncbi:Histidine kinase 1 [Acorus calamus]|uniref:Histidine kinase 1 n=1 Tax=Acorus calamus TaxID=4465 RepID=A0AAV9F3C4_ACOCL|nr:Histidine kinase 1 [Acorus calamus]
MESDSSTAVAWIQGKGKVPWKAFRVQFELRSILASLDTWQASQTYHLAAWRNSPGQTAICNNFCPKMLLGLNVPECVNDDNLVVFEEMGCSDSKSMKQAVIDEPSNNNIVPSKGNETIIFKNKLRALIVDDNCVNRKILKMMLKSIGVESQEVENGQEAVDLFVAGAVFDVVLIDKEMPIMDGPEATRVLHSMGIRSKMVGVSGNTREEEIKEFMDAGLDEYHVKPMTRPKLITIFKDIDAAIEPHI